MRISLNQRGAGHIVLLVAVTVVVAAGIVGYRVMQNNSPDATSRGSSKAEKPVPAKIDSKSDLQQASKALNSTDIDSSVNPNQLSSDLNGL